MEAKPWWQSKTIWINVVVFVLALVAYILRGVQTGEVPVQLDADTVAMLLSLIGIVMRFVTSQAVRK